MGVTSSSPAPTSVKLYYFPIAGKGDPIRMLIRYTGYEDFTDYRFADGEFPKLKAEGKFKFGQVPAIEVCTQAGTTHEICQTASILRYLGKSLPGGCYPDDPLKAALVDSILDQECDLFAGLGASKYRERFGFGCLDDGTVSKVRKSLNDEVIPRHLGFFESILSRSTTGWLADTEGPSIADFLLGPRLQWLASGVNDGISTGILEPFPLILQFVAKFHSLPAVSQYLSEQSK